MNQRRRGSIVGWLLGIVLIVVATIGVWQHQLIADSVRAWRFAPDAAVAQLAVTTTMTERGRMLFYASQSELQPAEQFNQSCENVEKTSAVLGCYVNRQIYIFDIDNAELDGIKEVTAAHEMLHAAYDRLSSGERREVDRMLDVAAEGLRSDEAFQNRIDAYDFGSVDERYNELHSIIGTEIAVLSPDLERYYEQYFVDRSQVVALHRQYREVFEGYQEQAEQMARDLDRRAATINASKLQYEQRVSQLSRDVEAFNQRAGAVGGFATRGEFEAARAHIVSRQSATEQERNHITTQIDEYNRRIEQYNGIARHITTLNNSIDSRLDPTPGVSL